MCSRLTLRSSRVSIASSVSNTANSRFFLLSLSNGQPLTQIGSDQGLLASPVDLKRLILGCAERADILIDFSQSSGETLHLRTSAFDILEFRVAKQSAASATLASIPKTLRSIERIPESAATTTRTLALYEYRDNAQRPMVMLINRKHWHEPVTETPKLNSTEIWEFVNLTEDTHPMHLHLVRFQILDRRTFYTTTYRLNERPAYTAPAMPAIRWVKYMNINITYCWVHMARPFAEHELIKLIDIVRRALDSDENYNLLFIETASKFQNIVPTGHIENQKRWRELSSCQIIRGMTSLVDTQSVCKRCNITDACMTSSCATWHYVAFIASFCRVIKI